MRPRPLVSIVIPAYNPRYFGEAFASALAQGWTPLEIVVCDDSPGGEIEAIVRQAADARVRYERNAARRGFSGNFTHGFEIARGDLVKFLNDDDRLRPHCVAALADVMESNPAIVLATSRRRVIDAAGEPRPDIAATQPLALVSSLMSGTELASFVLVNSINLIGEPTTALFRRGRLPREGTSIFAWGGRDYHCLADVSLWLRLLPQGLAYYHAAALSDYRVHAGQEQETIRWLCLEERWWILQQARSRGLLGHPQLAHAALRALRARATAWDNEPLDTAGRDALAALRREWDAFEASLQKPLESTL